MVVQRDAVFDAFELSKLSNASNLVFEIFIIALTLREPFDLHISDLTTYDFFCR